MARILTSGGKNAAGKALSYIPTGRPGFQRLVTSLRQTARVLSKSDPADGILSADINAMPYAAIGSKAALTTALTGTNNDLVHTATFYGPGGNSIRIAYVIAGTNTALSVSVSGNDVTVNVATDGAGAATSTATAVMNAINANTSAAKLVRSSLAAGNDGSGVVTALAQTALTGGAYAESKEFLPAELVQDPAGTTVVGREESLPTQVKSSELSNIERARFGDIRVVNRSTNRRIRKR